MIGGPPMSNARRKQQQKSRAHVAISAANATTEAESEDAKRKAIMSVVQVWLDRLQLVSTITTFFAGIDGTILSFAFNLSHVSEINKNTWSQSVKTMNSAIVGALIFHVCAAITSFVASFVLIRYKLIEERDLFSQSTSVPRITQSSQPSASSSDSEGARTEHLKPPPTRFDSAPPTIKRTDSSGSTVSHSRSPLLRATHVPDLFEVFQTWSDSIWEPQGRVAVHQVRFPGFGRRPPHSDLHMHPPVRLLSRCHTLSVTMAVLGFVLLLLGILVFAWDALPLCVSIFASACLGGCLFSICAVFSLSS